MLISFYMCLCMYVSICIICLVQHTSALYHHGHPHLKLKLPYNAHTHRQSSSHANLHSPKNPHPQWGDSQSSTSQMSSKDPAYLAMDLSRLATGLSGISQQANEQREHISWLLSPSHQVEPEAHSFYKFKTNNQHQTSVSFSPSAGSRRGVTRDPALLALLAQNTQSRLGTRASTRQSMNSASSLGGSRQLSSPQKSRNGTAAGRSRIASRAH